ncbi:MAG: glycosyltransferase, partial [Deltaproteobacteria bacterium]|nr:glycosyltransferase [Deltaproteobacteria bacterium]
MIPRPISIQHCELNLGQVHGPLDFGYFNPVFHCRTEEGEEFVARMRLHITEPLEGLLILDPRRFDDGGVAANSVLSPFLRRRSSYADALLSEEILRAPEGAADYRVYRITEKQIKTALLGGYDFSKASTKLLHKASSNPIRVAFTCHDPSIRGGGNTIIFRYANWLEELGIPVSIYSCGRPPFWTRVQARFRFFSDYRQMCAAIDEDVIILFSMWHIEPLLQTKPRDQMIYTITQGWEPNHYGTDYASMLTKKPVIELLESMPLGVITTSPSLADWYQKALGRPGGLISNGIDPRAFQPSSRLGRSPNQKTVISVGNPLHFLKGWKVMAEAIRLTAARNSDWNWNLVVASGEHVANFSFPEPRPANLNFQLRIGLNPQQMRELYQDGDVFVNPSFTEGFGIPTLEAMACGLPVVQADNRGLDFIIKDQHDCWLVPINDPLQMAEAIELLATDRGLAEQLRQNALNTARQYTTAHQFSMFVPVFEGVTQRSFPRNKVDKIVTRLSAQDRDRTPLISVVIPTYNQAQYLPQALDSLLAQTYEHWEAVVINDGSTDETASVLADYSQKDLRITGYHQANAGITAALNAGLARARGDFFCWLSSDDLFYPEKLAWQVSAFEDLSEEYALIYGSFDLLHQEENRLGTFPFFSPLIPGTEFPESLKFDFIDGCPIMIRMEAMREVGGFNPLYRHSQDFELWIRLASHGYRFHLLDKKLTIRRIHQAQSSTTNMINCRLDAARMMYYYLAKYHLLEFYRYLDLFKDEDRQFLVDHFISRLDHIGANINHPLVQPKVWAWFDQGLQALPAEIQKDILERCLKLILSSLERSPIMGQYHLECLASLGGGRGLESARSHKRMNLVYSVAGRDLMTDTSLDETIATELFEYGTDLLVNAKAPLFSQGLTLHELNKFLETPYKVGHLVLRYLTMFNNSYLDRLKPHADLSLIPQNERQALSLFCLIKYPDFFHDFETSLGFDPERSEEWPLVEAAEAGIAQLPLTYRNDLDSICRRGATEKLLFYWNALALTGRGRPEQAF